VIAGLGQLHDPGGGGSGGGEETVRDCVCYEENENCVIGARVTQSDKPRHG